MTVNFDGMSEKIRSLAVCLLLWETPTPTPTQTQTQTQTRDRRPKHPLASPGAAYAFLCSSFSLSSVRAQPNTRPMS